jgi:hypothetical protein
VKIFVAGVEKTVSSQVVLEYLKEHPGTAREFDALTGSFATIDRDLIKATRVFSSRISNDELGWFELAGRSAPWGLVETSAKLVDADPRESGGLYDRALELWGHFANQKKSGVAHAKISKVLHAMRPNFFPILDSVILKRYRRYAKECAVLLSDTRKGEYAYWAAIRNDLIDSSDGMAQLRAELRVMGSEVVKSWEKHISDVRLHDVVAWS